MADNYLEKKMEEHRNGTQRRTQRPSRQPDIGPASPLCHIM